ncbi:TetR family transcriptional regulator C-terminal domain-containing protein [Acerihabitans arboris]|uniref:TetR family transcriptional regulator n=1 Tax=Acerihabitans arboris TaxID=2691583 RepID=A0A845SGJ6_9GAMM|nr:TetR family transcriptional regulator C-terminal domain-containing protein [Acerihabitans arboris]NDL62186.1 TetR family transcriptional regulator [Acerihabitans arboris]
MIPSSIIRPITGATPPEAREARARLAGVEDSAGKGRIRLDNEAAILLAAERIFARYGFRGATMAMIADEARLPKPNIHYYFGNKHRLYLTVLDRILGDWLSPLDYFHPAACPRAVIERYVRAKMAFTFARPAASKLFASEILAGAPLALPLLATTLRQLVESKAAVIDGWITQGKLRRLDSTHLFFSIWAMTQTYADFDAQIAAVMGGAPMDQPERERATAHVVSAVFRICGLDEAETPA